MKINFMAAGILGIFCLCQLGHALEIELKVLRNYKLTLDSQNDKQCSYRAENSKTSFLGLDSGNGKVTFSIGPSTTKEIVLIAFPCGIVTPQNKDNLSIYVGGPWHPGLPLPVLKVEDTTKILWENK